MKILSIQDAKPQILSGITVSVIGYGAQGRAQALCLVDSGVTVIVGLREQGPSWNRAQQDGFKPVSIAQAAEQGQIIHILLPDEVHPSVYQHDIARFVTSGKTLSFSHGFSIVYGQIQPPDGVDVILVAPKSPGTEQRKAFVEGFGVPGLIAVGQDASGKAKDKALALAHALGLTRAGVLECSFQDEVHEDLFGEQAVLCGGLTQLIKAGFETLVEAGYPPEMAYFECLHELKLIVDLVYAGGLQHMWHVVSNTAEYGGRTMGPQIINAEARQAMKNMLADVQNGSFAERWMAEFRQGLPNLEKMRKEEAEHPIEQVGRRVRSLFQKVGEPAK